MTLILYVLLGALIIAFEAIRKPMHRFDGMFFTNLFYFVGYSFVPLTLILVPDWLYDPRTGSALNFDTSRIDLPLICIFGYCLLWLGWHAGKRSSNIRPLVRNPSKRQLQIILIFGLVVGMAGFFTYTAAFGGVREALLYGSAIRYGKIDIESFGLGKTEVFQHFIYALTLVILYYIAALVNGDRFRIFDKIIFSLSLAISLLFMLSDSSRGAVSNFIIANFVLSSYQKTYISRPLVNLVNLKFFIVVISGIFIVLYGKQFFWAIPKLIEGDFAGFISDFLQLNEIRLSYSFNIIRDTILKEFNHPITSLSAAIDYSGTLLIFRDFWLLPLHIIPANLLGLTINLPPTVSAINTLNLHDMLIASSPPGVLAMLIYNAGLLGLGLMFFYGFLGRRVQDRLLVSAQSNVRNFFLFLFSWFYGSFLMNADVKVYIYNAFPLFILLLWFAFKKLFSASRIRGVA